MTGRARVVAVVVGLGVLAAGWWLVTRSALPRASDEALRDPVTSTGQGARPATALPREPSGRDAGATNARLLLSVTLDGAPHRAHVDVLHNALAKVVMTAPSWEPAASVDLEGQRTLEVPPGQLIIVARGGIDAREARTLTALPGQTIELQFALRSGNGHRLEGVVVVGRTHDRVGGAELRLTTSNAGPLRRNVESPEALTWHTSAAADGSFSFEGIPAGLFELEAIAPGYGRVRLEHVAVPGPPVTVNLFASAYVEGHVVLPDGGPASGATVRAGGGDELVATDTSATGAFSLEVEPGAFFLTAHLGPLAARTPSRFTIASGETRKDVLLTLHAGGSISGRGTQAGSDAGLSDAIVSLSNAINPTFPDAPVFSSSFRSPTVLGLSHADATGHYVIDGVPAGTWDLTASWQGRQEVFRGLVVLAGEPHRQDFVFEPLGDVSGKVVHLDGGAFPNAIVALGADYDLFPEHLPHTRTASDGTFTLHDLAPGTVQLGAWAEGSSSMATTYVEADKRSTPVTLMLADGLGTVKGSITPAPGKVVRVRAMTEQQDRIARTFSDAEGRFEFKLDEGAWQLEAENPLSRAAHVQVENGVTSTVELHTDGVLKVTVLEPDGTPARGAWAYFQKATSGFAPQTDEFGVAWAQLDKLTDVTQVTGLCERRRGSAALPPNARELTVRCEPAASLSGEVKRSGPGIGAFTVTWSALTMNVELHFVGSHFEIDEVPTGWLALTVTTDDGWTGEVTLNLKSGEAGHTVVTVEPAKQ